MKGRVITNDPDWWKGWKPMSVWVLLDSVTADDKFKLYKGIEIIW